MDEELLMTVEENIEELPDEVKDFIFGDELKAVKEELFKQLDTETQKKELSNMLMFFLLQGKTEKELNDFIETLPIVDEKKFAIRAIIQEKVINELLLIIEASKELEEGTQTPTNGAKNIPTGLTNLADRLKQASIATPVVRNYSTDGKPMNPTPVEKSTSAIDPYHEPIDNE